METKNTTFDFFAINKKLWNDKTDVHVKSKFYDLETFKSGKSSLNPVELELLGDLKDTSVLHLQCHFGMDTLSLARLGAKVTGVDLSDRAIQVAKNLSAELQIDADFICCNIYDLKEHLQEEFDIVYTSYGVLGWLPELESWASLVKRFLKPNGKLILVEFHPVVNMMGFQWDGNLPYSYFNRGALIEEISGSYTDREAPVKNKAAEWDHSLGELFTALLNQNLTIQHFQEYDFSPYNCFTEATQLPDGNWQIKGAEGKIPLIYSLVVS